MMKKIVLVVVMAALAAGAWAQLSEGNKAEDRIIKEGEFAILYVEFLRLQEPEKGWTAQKAIDALEDLRIHHPEKWNPDADLIEFVMVELVRHAGIELVTPYPDRKVTVRQANAVFNRFWRVFNPMHPEYRTTTGEPATYIELEGNPGTTKSPSMY